MQANIFGKIDQKTGRAINRRLILNLIRTNDGLSRRKLADVSGLSRAAVSFVVNDLLEESILVAGKPEGSGAGRKQVPLSLNNECIFAIGIRLSVGRLDCMLTNLSMQLVDSHSLDLETMQPEDVVEAARIGVGALLDGIKDRAMILGAGFTSPGWFDPDTGRCVRNHRFGWRNVPIGDMLSACLGIPVFAENDTMAFGLAHHLFGLGQNNQNFAALAIGAGIGCALIAHGQVYRGALGNAGKVGHVLHGQPGEGPVCDCGRRGCLQAWYAVPALEKRWALTNQDLTLEDAVRAENKDALELIDEAADHIGAHLAEWVTVLDPEIIILGGESVRYGARFVSRMQAALNRGYYNENAPAIIPDETEFYWTAGAAAVAVQKMFTG